MASNQIPPAALDVLKRSRWQGNQFFLPKEVLDRKLYTQVNEVLARMGGKWNTKAKAHVFSDAGIIDSGEWEWA